MTSYLAAIAARDLDAAANDHRGEVSGRIMPRVASAHEPWTIPPVDPSIESTRPPDHDKSEAGLPRERPAEAVDSRQPPPVVPSIGEEGVAQRPMPAAANIERIESVKRNESPSVEREHRGDRRVERAVTTSEHVPPREARSQKDPTSAPPSDQLSPARRRDREPAREERDDRSHSAGPPIIVFPRARESVTVALRPREAERDEVGTREVASARSEEPTVIVTIGRIEVRAVTAQPASTPPRAEARSMMSLEDYLQQRVRGAR